MQSNKMQNLKALSGRSLIIIFTLDGPQRRKFVTTSRLLKYITKHVTYGKYVIRWILSSGILIYNV
jgi:hypothetical protein